MVWNAPFTYYLHNNSLVFIITTHSDLQEVLNRLYNRCFDDRSFDAVAVLWSRFCDHGFDDRCFVIAVLWSLLLPYSFVQAFQSTDRVERTVPIEALIRLTRPLTLATAKAVAAGNSGRQEDVIIAANMGRKAVSDFLHACKVKLQLNHNKMSEVIKFYRLQIYEIMRL